MQLHPLGYESRLLSWPVLSAVTPNRKPSLVEIRWYLSRMLDINSRLFAQQTQQTWLLQVEVCFCLHNITSQMTKFFRIVSCLPPGVAKESADVITTMDTVDPFDIFTVAIFARYP
ncbi:hypothetical protein V5799_033957 [Amblyomma americanum]|uniref:DUF7041 domain-containing protein n=1 Tax=Amblyomma americanum TaxID=6943 RepID=A0AAQ4DLU4_AMBAM